MKDERLISLSAALAALRTVFDTESYPVSGGGNYIYYEDAVEAIDALPPAESELEKKIRAIGYTGKEGRINIHGRLFAVRELPQ